MFYWNSDLVRACPIPCHPRKEQRNTKFHYPYPQIQGGIGLKMGIPLEYVSSAHGLGMKLNTVNRWVGARYVLRHIRHVP